MKKVKVFRKMYRRASQGVLIPFAEHIVTQIRAQEAFKPLLPEADALEMAIQKYARALSDAQSGSKASMVSKNTHKTLLVEQLDKVAEAVDNIAKGDVQLIVDAGFSPPPQNLQKYTDVLSAPTILRAVTNGKRGELNIRLNDDYPAMVRMHILEYSTDRGETWHNGCYNSYQKFVLRGLPHSPELWLKACALGTGDARSEWSAPVVTPVL
jgi:hypothetical protein